MSSTAAIQFDRVDIIFGRRQAAALALLDGGAERAAILEQTGCVLGVAGASLSVEPGQISVLMGLSGSGKSTLLRSVNGLNQVTRGNVLVAEDGKQINIGSCSARVLRRLRRRRVSMVFQQFALLPWRSVADNVGFGLELRGVSSAQRRRAVAEKLDLVGLSDRADSFVSELSGGMQQRVGLARAFATDADILLMDEPFSALDPLIRSRLQDELLALQRSLNKTILFVSHDLDEALKIGNQIAIMDSGRVVQYGEPEQIVLNPANAYVADFVAHMNPLDVLKGRSVMTPVKAYESAPNTLRIGDVTVELDSDFRPLRAATRGGELRLTDGTNGHQKDPTDSMIVADASIALREALKSRQNSGRSLLLVEQGRAVGVIGDDELYRAILGDRPRTG